VVHGDEDGGELHMGSAGAVFLVLARGRQGHPLVLGSIWASSMSEDCSPAAPASSSRGTASLGCTAPLPVAASATSSFREVHACIC
jgi:hypothetical protein